MNRKRKEIRMNSKNVFLAIILAIISMAGNATVMATPVIETSEQQQAGQVNGTVVDTFGEPIIGASILEKGTSNGTITDIDGNFTLTVKSGTTLVISYIGLQSVEVPATRNMKITLREDQQLLDEVVVIGYGVQKKKLITGATVQVKGEDIAKLNTTNVLEAMQSQSAGVNIVQKGGLFGSGYKVYIRGIGTNGDASPLYVIDGVVGGDLSALAPSDIESIDILKDSASAAIYGARAANGVILVTTKRGKEGKFEISYDGYFGVQNLYKIPTLLSAKEYMTMQDESLIMDGQAPENWAQLLPAHDLKAINEGTWTGTNWLKEILNEDAAIHSHALSFTGGSERSTFSIGFSYLNQEATMGVPRDMPAMEKYTARINTDHVVVKKNGLDALKIGQTLNYRYQESHGTVPSGEIYWNAVRNMMVMSPLMHAYNSSGDYYLHDDAMADGYKWNTSSGGHRNPIANMDYYMNQNKSKTYSMRSSFYADLQPIKNLHVKTQFGYAFAGSSYRAYIPRFAYLTEAVVGDKDRVTQSLSMGHQWTWDNTVNYNFDIQDHNFNIVLGQSLEKWGIGESVSGSNTDSNFYDFDHAYLVNVKRLDTIMSLTGSPYSPGAMASFFGRVLYDYKEKYMASAILRADGSSIFARGHRWGYFPSFSAGWVATNEEFMADTASWLNFLKLRVSWGQNGNSRVKPYQYLSPITSNNTWGGYPIGDSMGDAEIGSYGYRLTNPDLSWETQQQFNIGLDMRFLQSRLNVELDWYDRMTKDWLVDAPVLGSFGSGSVCVNGGDVQNTGFEAALSWNDMVKRDFTYGAKISFGYNKNEVKKIVNEDGIIHGRASVPWEGADEIYRAEVGRPFGYFYGYASDGIFQNQKQIDEYEGPLLLGNKTQPGDIIWRDTNGDGKLDADDRTMLGNPHPDFTLGMSFNVGWKGFDLAVTAYGAFGHQIFKSYRDYAISPLQNFTTEVYERWHGEGTSNKFPRLSRTHSNFTRISNLYIEDADYLKIKNVTLGYDFKKTFKNLPFQQLKLYVTVQNLFTFTGYSGMDPEVGYDGGNSDHTDSWASGIDLGFYPSARTFMIGTNIKF